MIALQMKIHFFRPQASEIIPVTSEPTNIPAKKQDCIVAPRNARLQIKFHLNINEKKGYDYLIEIILGQPSVRLPQCLSAFMLVLRLPLCPSVYQIICLFVSRVYARLTSCVYAYPFVGLPAHMATRTCLAWLSHCSPPSSPEKSFTSDTVL